MAFLAPLAALLGFELEGLTERLRAQAIVYALVAAFGLLGFVFLLGAIFMLVAAQIGPLYTSLIFAVVFLVLALAVYLGARISDGRQRKVIAERRRASEKGAFLTTAAATALPLLVRSPLIVKLGLPVAALLALVVMRNGDD